MKGFIYIAGSFETVNRSKCGRGRAWIDNDPHFWTNPPTWGICRNDLRRKAEKGDYIFFVLPAKAKHPQTLFAYMQIAEEKISHIKAYRRSDLVSKRMGNKSPNGNIIVDRSGKYNPFDGGGHQHMFEKIKNEYAIGDPNNSRFFTGPQIAALARTFLPTLSMILERAGARPIDLITRYGTQLSEQQVHSLLEWANASLSCA